MLAKLRNRRPSHATVVSYLALFVALGGTGAYAANTVFSTDIVDGEVTAPDLATGAVTREKIGSGAVIANKINNDAVTGNKVLDNSLGAADLGPDSVGASEVADESLGGADINESTLGLVTNAANLGGRAPGSFLSSTTKWKQLNTIGERLPVEIGNPPCSGSRDCTATIRCDPGDVLLSGGYDAVDNGTRLIAAFPFNANGFDQKFVVHWANNSTADTVRLSILCADQ